MKSPKKAGQKKVPLHHNPYYDAGLRYIIRIMLHMRMKIHKFNITEAEK